ncbi:MAG: glycosyltransferase family 9 protein [Methylophilales bacterium]|nr:glycosyltransferase family 9 protein [Methylophilales bacterium]
MKSQRSNTLPSQRTLIIQPLPGIGDMVWHLPFIEAISKFEESKKVDVLTIKRSMADQLFSHEEYVSDVLWLDDVLVGKSKLLDILKLAKKLRSLNYGRVWILHKSYHWALVAFLAGIPERWGYGFGWQRWFVNVGKRLNNNSLKLHPIDQAVNYLKLNGLLVEEVPPKIAVPNESVMQIEDRFKDYPKPWIALGIGATDSRRQWGNENFASLGNDMLGQCGGTIFLVGGASEKFMACQIKNSITSPSVVNIISYPIYEVIALFKACLVFVGNDSGMLHISAAVGTPSIGLFGMTYKKIDTYRLADEGRNIFAVIPNENTSEENVSSMHKISVAAVVQKAQQLMEKFQSDYS